MKQLIADFLSLIFMFSVSCISKRQTESEATQDISKIVLTGWLNENQLFDEIPAYKTGKNEYNPDTESMEYLKKVNQDLEIIVFLGSWCPDSKREVPRFLKVLQLAKNNHLKYKLFGLDKTKRDDEGLAETNNIERVPTFIVFQGENEIGRIIETPILSIEQDLVEILIQIEKTE